MNIKDYYQLDGDQLQFTEAQASEFAKAIAGDFNDRYGVSSDMKVKFEGLLAAGVALTLPATMSNHIVLNDAADKTYLEVNTSGDTVSDQQAVAALTQEYVEFSGKTFPDILVELMRKEGVMINPSRPLVIYTDMALSLTTTDLSSPTLKLADTSLAVDGKKGVATLRFELHDNNQLVGTGEKNMVLGGLREYDEAAMSSIVEQYQQWKTAYAGAQA